MVCPFGSMLEWITPRKKSTQKYLIRCEDSNIFSFFLLVQAVLPAKPLLFLIDFHFDAQHDNRALASASFWHLFS